MKKVVKIVIFGVLALAIAAAAVASHFKPTGVAAVTIEPKEAYAYFIEQGTVVTGNDFLLYPEVAGTVLETFVNEEDFINEGDIILEISGEDYKRQIAAHNAAISGYEAQIESALESERNAKDEYQASIDSLTAQLAQIEAQRKSAQAARLSVSSIPEQLDLLQITIDKLKTDISLSTDNVNKLTQLYENGVIPKSELDSAQNQLDASLSALRQYEAEYSQISEKAPAINMAEAGDEELFDSQQDSVNAQISSLSQNIAKDYSSSTVMYYNALIEAEKESIAGLEEKLEKCALISPVSGYLSDFPAKNLSALSPQSPAAVIKTESSIKIEAYVSTKDIGSIEEDDMVTLVLKGRDEDTSFEGKIESISKWAESKVTALGLDEKKVKVVITTEDEEGQLRSGYDLDVMFTVYKEPDKMLVPTSAIFTSEGDDYVFTIADGMAVKTKITKGVKTLTETVVESGLKKGDTVIITANTEGLKEGLRVKAQ